MAEIGHNGSKVIEPNEYGSCKFRNFHIQEIQECARKQGFLFAEIIYRCSLVTCSEKVIPIQMICNQGDNERFYHYLRNYLGILINGIHAVAFEKGTVYDPHGKIYPVEDFRNPVAAYIRTRI
jgi:hypothetical protein